MAKVIVNTVNCMILVAAVFTGSVFMQRAVKIPKTGFSCEGRPTGYYADLETGCRVYHMCDGLGRQFSYSCPNTTLFQQRMLICDHWYMVNCSASEKDYNANLLIGQRDKPFVSDSEDHKRTPRPDILSAPYAQGFNNYGGTEENNPVSTGSGNQLIDNTIGSGSDEKNNFINSFPLPTHWSTEISNINRYTTVAPIATKTGFTGRPVVLDDSSLNDNVLVPQSTEHNKVFVSPQVVKAPFGANQNAGKFSFQSAKSDVSKNSRDNGIQRINLFTDNVSFTQPSRELNAPQFNPAFPKPDQNQNNFRKTSSTTVKSIASFNNEFISNSKSTPDFASSAESQDTVFQFINRFNPDDDPYNRFEDSQTSANQYSTKSKQSDTTSSGFEIQSSSETAGFATSNNRNSNPPKKVPQTTNNQPSKVFLPVPFNKENKLNTFSPEQSLERSPTLKENVAQNQIDTNGIAKPSINLLPPKDEYSRAVASTMGPPIYYEWKWAAPALELEPPKLDSETKSNNQTQSKSGRPDFALPSSTTEKSSDSHITERSTSDQKASAGKNDYKVASYFIPDYIFPLDKQHPGYDESDAQTSFQVKIPRTANLEHPYYGENAECPECHPSFVVPGTCKPCIMIRR